MSSRFDPTIWLSVATLAFVFWSSRGMTGDASIAINASAMIATALGVITISLSRRVRALERALESRGIPVPDPNERDPH